jgi:hypothetical protein
MSRKLTLRWKGPCQVLERKSDNTYLIAFKGESHLINRDRLRLYISPAQDDDAYLETELQQVEAEMQQLNDFGLELQVKKRAAQHQHELVKAQQQAKGVSEGIDHGLPRAVAVDLNTESDMVTRSHALTVNMQF